MTTAQQQLILATVPVLKEHGVALNHAPRGACLA